MERSRRLGEGSGCGSAREGEEGRRGECRGGDGTWWLGLLALTASRDHRHFGSWRGRRTSVRQPTVSRPTKHTSRVHNHPRAPRHPIRRNQRIPAYRHPCVRHTQIVAPTRTGSGSRTGSAVAVGSEASTATAIYRSGFARAVLRETDFGGPRGGCQ